MDDRGFAGLRDWLAGDPESEDEDERPSAADGRGLQREFEFSAYTEDCRVFGFIHLEGERLSDALNELEEVHLDSVLLVALDGFVDAGAVAASAGSFLRHRWQSEQIATFDRDALIDYRARRPTAVVDSVADLPSLLSVGGDGVERRAGGDGVERRAGGDGVERGA
ncbi:MAG: PAC2 family protein [Chloroflexi bacterium]|nr:PAC2 family protein [Chloroflexota bacterium]